MSHSLCVFWTTLQDMGKNGILGSWILRKIIQNHQIKEHFEQSPAHLDFKAGKLYSKMQIILACSFFACFNKFLPIMFNVLIKFCEQN